MQDQSELDEPAPVDVDHWSGVRSVTNWNRTDDDQDFNRVMVWTDPVHPGPSGESATSLTSDLTL